MISQLRCIRGISDDEVAKLLKAGYQDQEDLQKVLDDSTATAIQHIEQKTGLQPERIVQLLDASLYQSSDQLSGNWLTRHWADLLLFMASLLIVLLPHLGKIAEEKTEKNKTEKPHVIAVRDLPPYIPLKSEDLASENYVSSKDADIHIGKLTGRYPTRFIKAHETIDDTNLSKSNTDLDRFSILRIALKDKSALEEISLPRNCELLFSSRGGVPSGATFQIRLLDLTLDGLNATVGVPNEKLSEIAKWIGNSDAYLFFPAQ